MATPDERRSLVFSSGPATSAESFLTHLLGPFLEQLTTSLALSQPDRPAAFAKAFALGAAYEGDVRGGDRFDEAAAKIYMSVLGGPLVHELMAALLALEAGARPGSKSALDAYVAGNVERLGAKVDAASVKISSSLRGVAARKRVASMRDDPEAQARRERAAASGAYAPGGVSGKAKKLAAKQAAAGAGASAAAASSSSASSSSSSAAGPVAGGADDLNASRVGRGEEKQAEVDAGDFEKYLRDQAVASGRAPAEEAAVADEGAAAAAAEAAAAAGGEAPAGDAPAGDAPAGDAPAGAAAAGGKPAMSHEQAAKKIESVGRGMVARKKAAAMKADPSFHEKLAAVKSNEAYSGGLTGKQRKRAEAAAAAKEALAAEGLASDGAFGGVLTALRDETGAIEAQMVAEVAESAAVNAQAAELQS